MAGLEDTDPGAETRRYGDTVGLPHSVSDGTPVDNATVQPGDAVTVDGSGNIAQAAEGDVVVGVLVNYTVYGDSNNNGPFVDGAYDATVAVNGTYKAHASGNVVVGSALGAPDVTNGASAGELDDAGQTNTSDQGFRAVDVYTDSSGQDWAEVSL